MCAVFAITLTLTGPVMATGTEASGFEVDAAFLRNHRGELTVPGTQVRGVLRQILEAMAQVKGGPVTSEVNRWFGTGSGNAAANGFFQPADAWAPARGLLRFGDLTAGKRDEGKTLTRIAVDAFTGSVVPGALQVVESPIGIGEQVEFSGTVTMDAAPDETARIANWIGEALKLVPAIGAHKSAGFGRVAGAILRPLARSAPGTPADAALIERIVSAGTAEFALTIEAPFLVAAERWRGNSFKGSSVIPGSTLKAVLGYNLGAADPSHQLHHALAGAFITEGRAVPANEPAAARPRTPPLSLFWVVPADGSSGELYDAFDEPPQPWGSIGSVHFRPDWKFDERRQAEIEQRYGVSPSLNFQVRTRTAIGANGAAEPSKLFSFAAVIPDGYVWKGYIGRGSLTDGEFEALIRALPRRIERLGKTEVAAGLTLQPAPTRQAVTAWPGAPVRLRLVLETDAVLHAPDDVFRYADLVPAERLRRQYADYFVAALAERATRDVPRVTAGELNLKFFATQRRVGGYLAARYPPSASGYNPWFVTERGAVFSLAIPASHRNAVQSFVERGLPVPASFPATQRVWSGNPFVPENGFGEVRLEAVTDV